MAASNHCAEAGDDATELGIVGMRNILSGKRTWLLKMAIELAELPIKHGDFP